VSAWADTLIERLNALSLRERALVLGLCMGGAFLLWDGMVLRPAQAHTSERETRRTSSQERIEDLRRKADEIGARLSLDLHAGLRERQVVLEAELARVDEQLRTHSDQIVPPDEMARLLEALLAEEKAVRVLRLEALTATPLFESAEGAAEDEAPLMYRHPMLIEFEGAFADTVRFLEKVEQLHWSLHWERLHYEVSTHPKAHVTVILHTLGARETWIGV
jgi:MSHA biogenesis protein MshJ